MRIAILIAISFSDFFHIAWEFKESSDSAPAALALHALQVITLACPAASSCR